MGGKPSKWDWAVEGQKREEMGIIDHYGFKERRMVAVVLRGIRSFVFGGKRTCLVGRKLRLDEDEAFERG